MYPPAKQGGIMLNVRLGYLGYEMLFLVLIFPEHLTRGICV